MTMSLGPCHNLQQQKLLGLILVIHSRSRSAPDPLFAPRASATSQIIHVTCLVKVSCSGRSYW